MRATMRLTVAFSCNTIGNVACTSHSTFYRSALRFPFAHTCSKTSVYISYLLTLVDNIGILFVTGNYCFSLYVLHYEWTEMNDENNYIIVLPLSPLSSLINILGLVPTKTVLPACVTYRKIVDFWRQIFPICYLIGQSFSYFVEIMWLCYKKKNNTFFPHIYLKNNSTKEAKVNKLFLSGYSNYLNILYF